MIDLFNGFEDIDNPKNLYQGDELHLSGAGYELISHWTQLALDSPMCFFWRSGVCESSETTVAPEAFPTNALTATPVASTSTTAVPTPTATLVNHAVSNSEHSMKLCLVLAPTLLGCVMNSNFVYSYFHGPERKPFLKSWYLRAELLYS